jgi:CMP-N-acetylneuraminic acid synthetase
VKIVALLPMMGQSIRVPGKNLKDFAGKPLFTRVLETLVKSPSIDAVVINTDSEEIANLALQFPKVKIHERPEEICGNDVPMNKIIGNDISRMEADLYLQTHATNPLLSVESIEKGIEAFKAAKGKFDSLFTVTKMQTRLYDGQGKAVNHDPNKLINTQDLPPLFEENSNFYLFTKESFFNNGENRLGKNPMMFEINKLESLDIDQPEDFQLAELVYKLKYEI